MTLSEAIRSGQSSREVMKLEKIAVGSPFSLFCRGQVRGPKVFFAEIVWFLRKPGDLLNSL